MNEGKFKIQAEELETVAKPVNGFTAMDFVSAQLQGVPGRARRF